MRNVILVVGCLMSALGVGIAWTSSSSGRRCSLCNEACCPKTRNCSCLHTDSCTCGDPTVIEAKAPHIDDLPSGR